MSEFSTIINQQTKSYKLQYNYCDVSFTKIAIAISVLLSLSKIFPDYFRLNSTLAYCQSQISVRWNKAVFPQRLGDWLVLGEMFVLACYVCMAVTCIN